MAIRSTEKQVFGVKTKNPLVHGENVVFIKGGSVLIDDRWIVFSDLRIDIQSIVNSYVNKNSRRLFNYRNDIMYVLIALNKNSEIEVIPNIAFKTDSTGDVREFPDLSLKLPLILVMLRQDGSSDLKSFSPISRLDIEIYQGVGNFTLRGDQGDTGLKGITGLKGTTGIKGFTGMPGITGISGYTGIVGFSVQGETGVAGQRGATVTTKIIDRVAPPIAAFSGSPLTGTTPLTVTYTDSSSGGVDSWFWDFGDGNTSSSQSPQNVYNSEGVYAVSLTASGPAGDDVEIKTGYVTAYDPVVAAFTVFPASGTAGATNFTIDATSSTGTITDYSWDFGDGTGQSGSDKQIVTHTYSTADTYTITLTVTGEAGSDSTTTQVTVS